MAERKSAEALLSELDDYRDALESRIPSLDKANVTIARKVMRILKGIQADLREADVGGATNLARELVRYIESLGGVVFGNQVGSSGEYRATIYSDEATKANHQFALRILDNVESVEIEAASPSQTSLL